VDLGLSRSGDYAVRAALTLASGERGRYRKTRDVARSMALPESYTPHILRSLALAGMAEARAGRSGGYRLSRPPEGITLLEVVEVAEGPLETVRCTLRGGPCGSDGHCAVHPAWIALAAAARESLAGWTLADLVSSGLSSSGAVRS